MSKIVSAFLDDSFNEWFADQAQFRLRSAPRVIHHQRALEFVVAQGFTKLQLTLENFEICFRSVAARFHPAQYPASQGRLINPDIDDNKCDCQTLRQPGKYHSLVNTNKARIDDNAEARDQAILGI